MIGEVWVCSGQSNMEMPMKGFMNQPILGSNEAIATSSNPGHPFIYCKKSNQSSAIWKILQEPGITVNLRTVSEFSATAYFFGLMLNKVLNVPIGLNKYKLGRYTY